MICWYLSGPNFFGLTPSRLTPLMAKTHEAQFKSALLAHRMGLVWWIVTDPEGKEIIRHGGSTFGYITFAGFDKARRRGVVILSSSWDGVDNELLGLLVLESEWQADRRPQEAKISNTDYDSYVQSKYCTKAFTRAMKFAAWAS